MKQQSATSDERIQIGAGRTEGDIYAFGPYTLIANEPTLLWVKEPVDIGRRALELLIELVRNAGDVVGKRELMEKVWPGRHVDEANLRTHIRILRAALGRNSGTERYIVNVPGRGYSFVARIRRATPTPETPSVADPTTTATDLPISLTRIIGRDEVIRTLSTRVIEHRLVTVIGSGGIGKTTVAIAVARAAAHTFAGVAFFVDLAKTMDAQQVAFAVAAALRVPVQARDPLPQLSLALRDTRALLILDNCEHVLSAVATLAQTLLQETTGIHMLATSREALDASGEWVHHLRPLEVPPARRGVTAVDAAAYTAVQLFVDRVASSVGNFALTDENASAVAEITRKLDGIPLTIEFGAPLVGLLGVHGLATELERRAELALKGRRTAVPRHRTLRAVLDWSYELLSPQQQRVLCDLSIFAGSFSLSGAAQVACADGGQPAVAQTLADLLAKSMLVHESGGYRLLATTRTYALTKLRQSSACSTVARRHAELILQGLRRGDTSRRSGGLQRFQQEVSNIRAALDWAASSDGDAHLAIELTLAAAPYWMQLSMLDECMARIEQALPLATGTDEASLRRRMTLLRPLASAEAFASGPSGRAEAIWSEILTIAEALDDGEWRLQALRGLWLNALNRGAAREALRTAERYQRIITGPPSGLERLLGDCMVGYALHLMGDHEGGRPSFESLITGYKEAPHEPQILRSPVDQEIIARMRLSLITWLRGYPDQAMRVAEAAARDAVGRGHSLSICSSLAQGAFPVALLRGDLSTAQHYASLIIEHAENGALYTFVLFARCASACIAIRRDGLLSDVQELQRTMAVPPIPAFGFLMTPFRAEFAQALGRAGKIDQGINLVEEAVARCEQGQENWYVPELLRIKAELMAQAEPATAEILLMRGIELARRHQARSWELRCAKDLAVLLRRQARQEEAEAMLRPVYETFTEGLETADLAAAGRLLEEFAASSSKPSLDGAHWRHDTGCSGMGASPAAMVPRSRGRTKQRPTG